MAKIIKKKIGSKKQAKKQEKIVMEDALPQNIQPMGEHVVEKKNIYISQSVYKEIHKFTKNKTENESGGMLVGNVIEALGKTNIIISGFVEAKHCEATPTTLKFTHETWDYVHSEIEEKFEGGKIVGWIHTHPDFGIFLSEYDTFIQENFFREEYQVAYVVDPIQHIEGFYFWINDRIEKCKGFYIFDKADEKIEIEAEAEENEEEQTEVVSGDYLKKSFGYMLAIVFGFAFLIMLVMYSNLSKRTEIMEHRYETLINDYESMEQNINSFGYGIGMSIDDLQNQIDTISANMIGIDETEEAKE